ncbi:NIPSNAP family protein [Pirellulaceae bacterium SH449]
MLRFAFSLALMLCASLNLNVASAKVYELRAYTVETGRQADALQLISEHSIGFMKKYNIDLVGVWTPVDTTDERIFMLVGHDSKEAGAKSWASFQSDSDWKKAVTASEKNGVKPVKGFTQTFLSANDYSPALTTGKVGDRVFELRTYIATPNNLPALNNRFRNHTLALFEKYGMTNIVYWSVLDGETTTCGQLLGSMSPVGKADAQVDSDLLASPVALVYFITHKSPEAARESFGKFIADPAWMKARAESEEAAGGSLTVGGGVKSLFLKATDFSPLQ